MCVFFIVSPLALAPVFNLLTLHCSGAFYMWESLHAVHAPLIPFVIYGAYELYHPKHWVNNTGIAPYYHICICNAYNRYFIL